MLIDVTRLLGRFLQGRRPTGVDRVSLAYIEHFQDEAQALVRFAGRWVVASKTESQALFRELRQPGADLSIRVRLLIAKNYVQFWRGPAPGSILVNTGHSGLDNSNYAQCVKRYRLRPLYFLHDLIPIRYPEYSRPGEFERHCRRFQGMISSAFGLVMNSLATSKDVEAYANSRRLALPPFVTAHLASACLPVPSTERPLAEPYFVILGTIEPRKNHLLLLQLWRQLCNELGSKTPYLVVIGQRGWECEQVIDILDRCDALKDKVIELSDCADAELATWLKHAQALLFPSFAEGFGIPLVEALSLGTPVICSDLPVFQELAGDIPEYLDPLDGLGWKTWIIEYAQPNSKSREAQLSRMTGWQAPTWQSHFAQIQGLMARCLN